MQEKNPIPGSNTPIPPAEKAPTPPPAQGKMVPVKGKFPWSRHSHSLIFLGLLVLDLTAASLFVRLAHFRSLSGWDGELSFDSLTFNWKKTSGILSLFDALAFLCLALGFWFKDIYRFLWFFLAPLFLVNLVFPFGMAFHYLRGFSFVLFLGMLLNGWAFAILAFSRKKMGLIEKTNEKGGGIG
jgi:hypothetical protein